MQKTTFGIFKHRIILPDILYGLGKRCGKFLIAICLVLCMLAGCTTGETKTPATIELTDEAYTALYEGAQEAWALLWEDPGSLVMNTEGHSAEHNGTTYFEVKSKFESLDDIRAYLKAYFSQEWIDKMLDPNGAFPVYIEKDGVLLGLFASRGGNMYYCGEKSVVKTVVDDKKIEVIRTVLYSSDRENVIAHAEQKLILIYEDGAWVFDAFVPYDDTSNLIEVEPYPLEGQSPYGASEE